MSDLRKDPLTDDWAIIAENRGDRPIEYQQQFQRNGQYTCPFCVGNETQTPPTIREYRKESAAKKASATDSHQDAQSNLEDWIVRVVPNKYPALSDKPATEEADVHAIADDSSLVVSRPAVGANEIIIESPRHVVSFSELTAEELSHTMVAFRDAIQRCRNDKKTESISLFKNCRFQAGASIEHTHSQVIALPIVTSQIERQLQNCLDFKQRTGKRLQQSIIDDELANQQRVFFSDNEFVAWCPFASRTPYQICISQITKQTQFEDLTSDESLRLAQLIRKTVASLETALENPAYNLIIQLAPLRIDAADYYQWYVQLFPRVTRPAGLELGTACWINPISPEQAASRLRTELERI